MSPEDAEEYTQTVEMVLGGGWRQIALGQKLGVPAALGLANRQWVQERLGGFVRYTFAQRVNIARELTAPESEGGFGLTHRQAADVLGVAQPTITESVRGERYDRKPINDGTPEPSEASLLDRKPINGFDDFDRRMVEEEMWAGMPESRTPTFGDIEDALMADGEAEANMDEYAAAQAFRRLVMEERSLLREYEPGTGLSRLQEAEFREYLEVVDRIVAKWEAIRAALRAQTQLQIVR